MPVHSPVHPLLTRFPSAFFAALLSDADEMFAGLRIEYSMSLILSVAGLYSFAQLGGIPRPSADEEKEPRVNARLQPHLFCFWLAWMVAQVRAGWWSPQSPPKPSR